MVKNVLLFVFFMFAGACADSEPPGFDPRDASQLTGLWRQQGALAKWVWHFDGNGLLTQSIFDFNAEVWTNKKAYWTSADTLRTFDLDSGVEKAYTVYFESGATAILTDTSAHGLSHKLVRF